MTTKIDRDIVKNELLNGFREWLEVDEEEGEERFNEYVTDCIESGSQANGLPDLDNVINGSNGVGFDYCTFVVDRNSDDVLIQVTVPVKGGMALIVESFDDVPFSNLETCASFVIRMNEKVESLRISDYTDVTGAKTQIIIEHN